MEIKQMLDVIAERIKSSGADGCPGSAGLHVNLCFGCPEVSCLECWLLAIRMYLESKAN